MNKKIIVGLSLLVALLGAWFFNDGNLRSKIDNVIMQDINGKEVVLNKGKPVFVNFWATDCPSCVTEMPKIEKLYQKYKERGFRVIAIAMSYDKPELINAFITKYNLNFTFVNDENDFLVKKFNNIFVIPTSFLLDGSGYILQQSIGEPEWELWDKKILVLLNEKQ